MTDKKNHKNQTLATQNAELAASKVKSIEEILVGSEAGQIWSEIKDKTIQMFALPDQKISDYAAPSPVEPSKLYLVARASSALPAIKAALGKNYTVDLVDRYLVAR